MAPRQAVVPSKRAGRNGFEPVCEILSCVGILSSSGKGEALASELGGVGVTGSNQSTNDIRKLADLAMQRWGRIDVLVNSAGHGPRAEILYITDEQWHAGMEVSLLGAIRVVRLVMPVMQAQKAGIIVNISAARTFEPTGMFATSAVFRSGLAAFAKVFADRYGADNIRINNILPGQIDSLPEVEARRQGVPIERCGTSAEVAATLAFLASEGAACITGQNLRVDGGLTRSV